jgi:hypothetical protein
MIISDKTKRLCGWIGLICLLLIIPVKAVRFADRLWVTSAIPGTAPSFLGPAGLLFLLLSSSSPKLTRLSLLQMTILVASVAIGLEFLQLVPRPGILARVHYTFDWLDVAASFFSVFAAYVVARLLTHSTK